MGHTKSYLRRKALNKIAAQKAAELRRKKKLGAETGQEHSAAALTAAAVAEAAGQHQHDELLPVHGAGQRAEEVLEAFWVTQISSKMQQQCNSIIIIIIIISSSSSSLKSRRVTSNATR
jgi:hypothetical protein